MNILDGLEAHADDWLNVEPKGKPPYYRSKTAANELSRRTSPIAGTLDFLNACYAQIHQDWSAAVAAGNWSRSNKTWRWKQILTLDKENDSPEVKLEQAIVNACGDDWSNQMPTASGLVGSRANRRTAVDLVYREDATTYSFIELKVASNYPLYAAIEILMHGVLFVWSENNQEKLGADLQAQPVLAAQSVTLGVLAPREYYQGFDLTMLATALNSGLDIFGEQNGVALRFEFCELGVDYSPDLEPGHVKSAIEDRRPIWVAE